ncbi:hypothetical protein EGM51_09555 [Verrucomicrobia bacterium S94]|nr:hypothetical protein EGM51_09555 [Verrucomicrobia bacterium S94]
MDTNENNVSGRASYMEDERRELMEEFYSSRLTRAPFCREWNINPKTLARWQKVVREEAAVSFCEVDIQSESPPVDDLRICLPNGIEVQLRISCLSELGTVLQEEC